jgi:hypothetical protein
MALRRGFKTEVNSLSVSIRRELQLADHSPLCPWRLAKHLDIPIRTLADLRNIEPDGAAYLRGLGKDLFSAVTIFVGRRGLRRMIFHNDAHARSRQSSNLAHELAHAILCHPPTPPFVVDEAAEEEAKWFGPTLLIPNEAAFHIVRQEISIQTAQTLYGVSSKLLEMRINVSGARIRMQRRKW